MILDARDPVEALRLRPVRRYVVRRGRVISQTAAPIAQLSLDGRPQSVNFRLG